MADKKLQNAEHTTFKREDFSGQLLSGKTFSNCTFEHCNFTDSSWQKSTFIDCIFKHCNISLVSLKSARFQGVLFQECKLVGLEFCKCDTSFLFSLNIKDSFVKYCNFSNLDMRKTSLAKCKMFDCTFLNTFLFESDFSETDLQGSMFRNCDLTKANFADAKNYVIDPSLNKIKKAIFSFPAVVGLLKGFDITIKF